MKKLIQTSSTFLYLGIISFLAIGTMNSCNKSDDTPAVPVIAQNYTQANLVSNTGSFTGSRADTNLINAWGIAFSPTGTAWISSQGKAATTVYDQAGVQKLAPVSIPSATATTGGSPTGQVFNSTTDFVLSNGSAARFIFAGTDGVISGWSSGTAALRAVDRSATSAYTGLTNGANAGSNYLYAADFRGAKIDVFDKNFALVSMPFTDPGIPTGYAPFNVQNVSGQLFVTYAKVDATTHKEAKGSGLGYVDIFTTGGVLLKRFVSQADLNAPWGVAQAPANYLGTTDSAVVLIGNFGDGHINAYTNSGTFLGNLRVNGTPFAVDGLWAITFAPTTATAIDPNTLFFAAGPGDEHQGVFGYLKK